MSACGFRYICDGVLPCAVKLTSCWDVIAFIGVHPRRLMATYIIQTCTSTPLRTPCYAVGLNIVCGCPLDERKASCPRTLLRTRRPLSEHLLATRRRCRSTRRTTTSASSCRCFCVLLRVDLLDNLLNLLCLQVADLVAGCHDCDLDVLCASLHDFEERFDGQLDGAGAVEGVGVVALEEFADGFGGAADGVCFPGWKLVSEFPKKKVQ
jgi:hypothetical protein